jgi:hypothetical protein
VHEGILRDEGGGMKDEPHMACCYNLLMHLNKALNQILETLAARPSPEDILALRAPSEVQARIEELLIKNGNSGLSSDEQCEWEHYEHVEHMVRLAKARALLELHDRKQG